MSSVAHPLGGVRVLNLGGIWAGRVASMLLADQGAEVIEINRPGRIVGLEEAHLGRGKRSLSMDLKSKTGQGEARSLAVNAHIIFDNLGFDRARRFGLDHETIAAANPQVVYVSMPGFAKGSRQEDLASWEGSIAAAMGVYTDIHALGPLLGGPPIFSALPMASAYGGVHAAIAASMAFLHRVRTGAGQQIEVPLADALMSAMAMLALKIEDLPQRYDLPPIEKAMTEIAFPILRDLSAHLTPAHRATLQAYFGRFSRPQASNYPCADGKLLYITAADHVHLARAGLEVLGLLDELIAEGMVVGSPWEEGQDGNNLSDFVGLSPHWRQRLQRGIAERLKQKPAHEWEVAFGQAGVPATVVRTTTEWLNWPVAREGGNVAALTDPELGSTVQAGRYVSIEGSGTRSPSLRSRRNDASERAWTSAPISFPPVAGSESSKKILSGLRVLDFANVIAGPSAGRTLAEFGADVTRIDPPAPLAGPRLLMWTGIDVNQGKRAAILNLKSVEGRRLLERMIQNTDVVIHNFLDRSLGGIGLSDEQLRAINPDIIVCQVSAWGGPGPGGGPYKEFPAFDPVLQAATGITARYGTPEVPVMHGIASCVDYITGFSAASGIAQALIARALGRGGSYVRTSLSMGTQLVQFPFVVSADGKVNASEPSGQHATGYGPHYRMYKASDGWIFLACRKSDIAVTAEKIGAKNATDAELTAAIAASSVSELTKRLEGIPSASIVPVTRLDALRSRCTLSSLPRDENPESVAMFEESAHPSGHRMNLPLPTWHRQKSHVVSRLEPARPPGADTRLVFAALGLSNAEIDDLASRHVVADGWAVLKHYLPR